MPLYPYHGKINILKMTRRNKDTDEVEIMIKRKKNENEALRKILKKLEDNQPKKKIDSKS